MTCRVFPRGVHTTTHEPTAKLSRGDEPRLAVVPAFIRCGRCASREHLGGVGEIKAAISRAAARVAGSNVMRTIYVATENSGRKSRRETTLAVYLAVAIAQSSQRNLLRSSPERPVDTPVDRLSEVSRVLPNRVNCGPGDDGEKKR